MPPRKGRRHVLRIVRDILSFEPIGRGTDLVHALDRERLVQETRGNVSLQVNDTETAGAFEIKARGKMQIDEPLHKPRYVSPRFDHFLQRADSTDNFRVSTLH